MNAALLFICTFALVFALGLQSQLVNNGHYAGAFCNSVLIGTAQFGSLLVVDATTALEVAAYIGGGPLGIVASMYFYRKRYRGKQCSSPS